MTPNLSELRFQFSPVELSNGTGAIASMENLEDWIIGLSGELDRDPIPLKLDSG